MRVCMRVGAWVGYFAEVSKIVQDAPRAGTQAPEQPRPERERPPEPEHRDTAGAKEHKHQSDHHNRNTSDHHKSTRAGAPAHTQRTRIAKEITKTIAN